MYSTKSQRSRAATESCPRKFESPRTGTTPSCLPGSRVPGVPRCEPCTKPGSGPGCGQPRKISRLEALRVQQRRISQHFAELDEGRREADAKAPRQGHPPEKELGEAPEPRAVAMAL